MIQVNKYTIEDFNNILKNMEIKKINDDIKNIIDNLCEYLHIDDKDKCNEKNNFYRNKKNFNNMQWYSIRNFQKTKILKNELEFNIRNILNKITDNNYNTQKDELIKIINNINKDDNYEENLNNIYNIIMDIIKNNIYFSIIYAKIYKDLFYTNNFFLEKLIEDGKNLSKYLLLIENNKDNSKDNNNDYTEFCNYNKNNDQKKTILLFFINVFKSDEENSNILIKILDNILEVFEKNIMKIEEKENNENLIELILIIMTNISVIDDKYKNHLIKISNYKVKNYSGLSNKIIFKLLDILDKYN